MEGSGGAWKMAFVMPSKFTMETLPKPKNPNITIKQIPAQQLAVVTFSGWVDEEKLAAQTTRLNEWMAKNGLKTSGSAQLSRYNPPWTLPFWRRNEVWMKLD
jgi:predicted transcriptional regulator YdeE